MSNELAKSVSPFEITTFEQLERFAKLIAESDFAPKDYKSKPGNVIVAVQFGYELGLKPMQAIQNISVVNGRPMVWGDAALALVIGNPECKGVREWMDGTIKSGNAVAYCEAKRNDQVITRHFSVAQAVQAGLLSKAGTWTQYPERMLQLRARGFALRDSFPDVLKGVYIEGELIEETEYQVVEEKETAKLGVNAVKQAVVKVVDAMVEDIKQKAEEVGIDPETGEIEAQKGAPSFAEVKKQMESAQTVDDLIIASDVARSLNFPKEQRDELAAIYKKKQVEVKG